MILKKFLWPAQPSENYGNTEECCGVLELHKEIRLDRSEILDCSTNWDFKCLSHLRIGFVSLSGIYRER